MSDDLVPCPFCGGKAERVDIEEEGDNFGGSCISCSQCGASSPLHFDRKENLESSWNQRAHPQPPLERTEQEWRPIETAPKDGIRFLALHRSGAMTLAEVTGPRDWKTNEPSDWDCFAVAFRCSTQNALSDFTHWQPLPKPPTAEN